MTYLHWATGDPLVFWTAKAGWDEMTLVEFVADPLYQPLAVFHVVTFLVFVVPYLMRFRTQPPAWGVIVLLTVVAAARAGRDRPRPVLRAGVSHGVRHCGRAVSPAFVGTDPRLLAAGAVALVALGTSGGRAVMGSLTRWLDSDGRRLRTR